MTGYGREDRKRVALGTALNAVGGLWLAAFKAMGFVLRALFGGPAYGLFAVAQNVTELASYVLLGGFSDAIVYFGSRHLHRDQAGNEPDSDALYRALATCIAVPFLLAIALMFGVQFGVELIYSRVWAQHDPLIKDLVHQLSFALPLMVLMHLPAEATKAHLQFHWQVLVVQVLFPSLTLGATLVIHAVWDAGIVSLALGVVAAQLLCVPVSLWAFSRHFSVARTARAILSMRWDREVLSFAGPQSVNMVLNLGLNRLDTLLLSGFVTSNAIGIYALVSESTQLIRMAKLAFSGAFTPLVAKYHSMGNRRGIEEALHALIQLTSSLSVPLLFAILSLYPHFILADGETWTESLLFPWLLCVGPMMSCFFGLAGNLLLMTGHSRMLLRNAVGAAALNVALNMLLIPQWGLLGAATGTAVANFAISFAQIVEMGRYERIRFHAGLYARTLAAAAPGLAIVIWMQGAGFATLAASLGGSLLSAKVVFVAFAIGLYAGVHLGWPGENPLRSSIVTAGVRLRRATGL